jgi:hypothetical protein
VCEEPGALRTWWSEHRAGRTQGLWRGPLYRAACLEARARDAIRDGQFDAANRDRIEAACILLGPTEAVGIAA